MFADCLAQTERSAATSKTHGNGQEEHGLQLDISRHEEMLTFLKCNSLTLQTQDK